MHDPLSYNYFLLGFKQVDKQQQKLQQQQYQQQQQHIASEQQQQQQQLQINEGKLVTFNLTWL